LKQFLDDQAFHIKKIGEKVTQMKAEVDKKELIEVLVKPNIDKKSVKISNDLNKEIKDPTHIRLYKKKDKIKKEKNS